MSWVAELLPSQYFLLLTGTIPWPDFPFTIKNTQALIDMRDNDTPMVRL